ncbi:hypothetical protein D3D02_16705 [Halobellus sp. Atlit-38R]|jgi:hypothetical protein|uniref:hypothetical protein n=1 Tax=Halobellus sp. Atlit-38R TaxID=2282131 RepID=UPI000EF2540F|nr:hypothetical protein [Halobellus sp. Atlit-38R]RLM83784.1 hypothetical protein D3D02_16705 [Halobellus sp. Atlit-38R]
MNPSRPAPGPDAARAFRLGIAAGALVGLAFAGLVYWTGSVDIFAFGYVFALLFPVYLVLVAIALSVWLGYDKDETALRPVYRTER